MGGIPLVVGIQGARMASGSHRSYAGGRVLVSPRGGIGAMNELRRALDDVAARAPSGAAGSGRPGDDDTASRLERLARLHRAGDLTDAEFEAAKRATIDMEDAR